MKYELQSKVDNDITYYSVVDENKNIVINDDQSKDKVLMMLYYMFHKEIPKEEVNQVLASLE